MTTRPTTPPGDDPLARLDAEIADRIRALGQATTRSREQLLTGVASEAIEPRRNWHVYSLGADLHTCGLTGDDASAVMGFRSLPLARAIRMLLDADAVQPGAYLGRLLAHIVDAHRDMLVARGTLVSWKRRWVKYRADVARWQAQPDDVKRGHWRERVMTSGQRELVRETAVRLGLVMPDGLDRGRAADWLDSRGANLDFRKEM